MKTNQKVNKDITMNALRIVKVLTVLAAVATINFTVAADASAAKKSIYFKNCNQSGWDVDVWVIDTGNGADGFDKFLSPGKDVTLYCEDDIKCEAQAAIGLDFYDFAYVYQSDNQPAQFYIRTVPKFLHVDLHWDTTGNVCTQNY